MESQTIQRPRRLMAGLFFLAGLRRGRKVMSCLPRYSSPVSLSSWKSLVANVVGWPLNASDEGSERHRWTKRVCLWVKPYKRTSLDPMDCGEIRGLILQRICGVRACGVRQPILGPTARLMYNIYYSTTRHKLAYKNWYIKISTLIKTPNWGSNPKPRDKKTNMVANATSQSTIATAKIQDRSKVVILQILVNFGCTLWIV